MGLEVAHLTARPKDPEGGVELFVVADRDFELRDCLLSVVRVQPVLPRIHGMTEILRRDSVERVHGRVPRQLVRRHVPVPHAQLGGARRQRQAFRTLAQQVVGLPLLGDVLHGSIDASGSTRAISLDERSYVHPAHLTVWAAHPMVEIVVRAAAGGGLARLLDGCSVARIQQRQRGLDRGHCARRDSQDAMALTTQHHALVTADASRPGADVRQPAHVLNVGQGAHLPLGRWRTLATSRSGPRPRRLGSRRALASWRALRRL